MSEGLGSYNQFLEERGLEHGPMAMEEYTFALHSLRENLAAARGIKVEDLHDIPNVIVRTESAA